MLPVVTFSSLFAKLGYTDIDFLSVDFEGATEAVLRSIDWDRVTIRVIVVEGPNEQTVAFLHEQVYTAPTVRQGRRSHLHMHARMRMPHARHRCACTWSHALARTSTHVAGARACK